MKIYRFPAKKEWTALMRRPLFDFSNLEEKVAQILQTVAQEGDAALRHYAQLFDKVEPHLLADLAVSEAEILEAEALLSSELKQAIQEAIANIRLFHQAQKEDFEPLEVAQGVRCWRKSVAIEKVGLYIPGGTAPLFSTVLMLGVPAQIAGCRQIVLTTPPNREGKIHPAILYAASQVGISQIFKVGGAQAIAALAYGTESVPAVYKIFGPGNQYVTAAKQYVARSGVAIDMPAGPSEVLVMADSSADPAFIAADLLSQAEHGVDSQVIFLTDTELLLEAVQKELALQLEQLPRKTLAKAALENSLMVLLGSKSEMIEFSNQYAPEHLIIAFDDAQEQAQHIEEAGSVFLGHYTPESVGDYASGTNHTLPTNGFARAYSGVSLDSFIKKITFQSLTPQGLQHLGRTVELMAQAEELFAHKNAVSLRLAKLRQ
jgi:histidinol dehydrogenase